MSNKAIPEVYARKFDIPGIVADPATMDESSCVYLTRDRWIALFSHTDRFFDGVPIFDPLRGSVIQALNTLANKGIIGLGDKAPSKGGCRACQMKILMAVFMQMLRHVQTLIIHWKKVGALDTVGKQLRAYVNVPDDKRLVVILRGNDGNLERVEF